MGTITFTVKDGIQVQDEYLAMYAKVLKPEILSRLTVLVKKTNTKAKTGYDICRGVGIDEILQNTFMRGK